MIYNQGYGGGPLARKVGDFLSHQGVTISCLYGTTEIGIPTTLSDGAEDRVPEDWSYMRMDKDVNMRWVPQGDGTFESQFLVRTSVELSVFLV